MPAEIVDETLTLFDIETSTFEYRAAGVGIDHRDGLILSPTNLLKPFLSCQVGDRSFLKGEPEFTPRKKAED